MHTNFLRRVAMLGAAIGIASCGDPLEVREPPTDSRVSALLIIDPGIGIQTLLVQHPDLVGANIAASVASGGVPVADAANLAATADTALFPCNPPDHFVQPYGRVPARCLNLRFFAEYGREYTVSMTADGLRSAQARTTVPGDFTILSHEVTGTAEDGISLSMSWTRSVGAFRYVVAVSPAEGLICAPIDEFCPPIRWFGVTEDTTLSATIGPELFRSVGFPVEPPWRVSLYAMNKDLYAYLFTGATSDFFPVPPGQNVVGGFGAVGAWVRREVFTDRGLMLERVAGGIRLTNQMDVEARYEMRDLHSEFSSLELCDLPGNEPCGALAPGESRIVPLTEVRAFRPSTRFVALRLKSFAFAEFIVVVL